MPFPFQRYKYFKLLVFWRLCDVTATLHQFYTCVRPLLYLNTIEFEYNTMSEFHK